MVASDDPRWCQDHLSALPDYLKDRSSKSNNKTKIIGSAAEDGDDLVSIHFTSEYYPSAPVNLVAFDLAVLARCNHSIFDYGTFGFWGAYLAGKLLLGRSFEPF